MNLFKKFTDFCAGIAAFVGGLFLIQKYMTFKPLDDEGYTRLLSYDNVNVSDSASEELIAAPSKITQFFTPKLNGDYDYRLLLLLILALAVSIIVGLIFRKLPYVCFFIAIIPALMTAYLLTRGYLYTQIGLFMIVALLHLAGNLFECTVRDREDGKHRLWVCAKISLLFPAAFCLLCTKITDKVLTMDITDRIPIYHDISTQMTVPDNMEIITRIGWMYLVIFAISTLLYNVYFIDAILSAIPLGYTVYLLYGEFLTFNPALFAFLALICFMTHITLVACENNLSRKEQMKMKEKSKGD